MLDKVKALSLLPDGVHVTTDGVASYYEVDAAAIRQLVQRHKDEIVSNGWRVPAGQEFSDITSLKLSGRPPALFTRRTILNVGMLLRDSEVARQVRPYRFPVCQAMHGCPQSCYECNQGHWVQVG